MISRSLDLSLPQRLVVSIVEQLLRTSKAVTVGCCIPFLLVGIHFISSLTWVFSLHIQERTQRLQEAPYQLGQAVGGQSGVRLGNERRYLSLYFLTE